MAEVDFQFLVESNLMSSGEFTNAIIMNDSGDETWGSSPDCSSMSATERKGIAGLWKNKAMARKNGFTILGNKYTCKTIDDDNLVGAGVGFLLSINIGQMNKEIKRKDADTMSIQSEGLVVGYKSDETITVGVVTKGQPQGLATIQIVGLGEYFKQSGY
ncbi:MAG: hypothetical protein Q9166_002968 [cf. Caloplaca sp. 2 TL-2023]